MGGAADLERELADSRAREAALAEVLGLMRGAPGELPVVLKTVLDRAASLCGAERASIHLLDGDVYRTAAFWGPPNPDYERVAYDTTRTPGRETLIGRTALDKTVVHIPDVLSDREYTATELQRLGGYRTMLGVPLFRGAMVAGVFVLTRNEVRPFTDGEIALVRAFADQAVVAVENARLLKSTSDALERQTAVSEVLSDMSRSVFDLDRVLESVAMNAVRLCAADNGSIAQLKADGWRLVANVGDIDAESMERNWGNQPIEADRRSLTGRVLVDRRTTTIVDAQADPEYDAGVGLFNVRSLIGVPLTHGEDIVGVLILRRQEPRPFTPEEIHLLETFADQASIAIENVRLFDETKEALERQTALAEILQIISKPHTDLRTIADAVARSAARYCAAENATVFLADGDSYRLVASTGPLPNLGPDLQRTTPLTTNGRALLDGRTIHVADLQSSDEFPLGRELAIRLGFRTALSTPILRGDRAIGTITLRRQDVRPFSHHEVSLLEAFAAQGAIAIENVRLFDETKEALEQQTAVSELLGTISRSAFDLDRVLTAIIERATQLAGAENGFVYQVDGQVLRMTAAVGEKAELMREWQRENPIRANDRGTSTGRSFTEGRTVHIPDVFADPEYKYWEAQKLGNFRTLLTVPLIRQGTTVGAIAMWRTEMRPFSENAISLVETFADQAAIAMANVELFRTVERQRGELSRFLSPQVAALITSEQGARMLEGHRRQITVAFCDLRGFTAFAETAEPEEVLGVLREYHRAMGEIIVEHRGTLEHFAGDGMMVFFNDPLPVERHELQAVRMTFAMRARFEEMARGWRKRGYELGFGVGIATGYATLGRIGFEGRYDYGAIGNVVILAQRLSAEAKAGQILISQRVQAAIEPDAQTTALGDLTLKGFTRPVPTFAAESLKSPEPARP